MPQAPLRRPGYRSVLRRTLASLAIPAALVLFAPIAFNAIAMADADRTTFILVRHAEKADDGTRDPSLTEAGVARAAELARVLADAEIAAIHSTQLKRTRLTGGPLAEQLDIEVTIDTLGPEGLEAWLASTSARLLEEYRGRNVLIVGHSNTVPALIEALGVPEAPPIAESEYDDLFVVTVPSSGEPSLLHLRYGVPSP